MESPDNKSPKFFEFTIYISGINSKSGQAIETMKKICEEHLKGRYKLKVIDLTLHPEKGKSHEVIALPTVVKELPLPVQKVIGDLSNIKKIMIEMDIR